MSAISIPYHLILPSLTSFLILLSMIHYRKRWFRGKRQAFWISLVVFFLLYFLIVGFNAFFDIYYQWDLIQYDLNQDGNFSENERTEDQQKAMSKVIADVGRNFSVFTGAIFAFLISLITFLCLKVIPWLQGAFKELNH